MTEEKQKVYSDEDAIAIVDGFISIAKDETIMRASTFAKYEEFVIDGEQWDLDEKPEGNKPCITFNQSEDFVNTYMAKLFPRNSASGTLQVGVKVTEKDGTKKEQYEKEIADVYDKNKFPQTILEQAQNFFIGGAGCFYYPQDPTSGSAKIISIDPTTVFLGWTGGILNQFAFEDEITLAETEKDTKRNWLIEFVKKVLDDGKEATKRFEKVKRITYWDKNAQIVKVGNSVKIAKNTFGFIPFSWIPNQPKAHRHEGIPEAKKLWSLEKEYNKRASDFALRVKENSKPKLAVSSDLDKTDLEINEETGILPLAKGEEAKFLTLSENKEALDWLAGMDKKMANKMAVNDAIAGEIKSNVSSLSMVYYFSPLMDRIGLKRVYWDEAFRELNRAILIYKFGVDNVKTNPVYEPVLLTDTKTKIENTVLLLENNLISHKDAIDELRATENSGEKIKEILKEKDLFEPKKEEDVTL